MSVSRWGGVRLETFSTIIGKKIACERWGRPWRGKGAVVQHFHHFHERHKRRQEGSQILGTTQRPKNGPSRNDVQTRALAFFEGYNILGTWYNTPGMT